MMWYVGEARKTPRREHKPKVRNEQSVNSSTDEAHGVYLYVQNLDDGFDDNKLKEVFSPFGTVTSCKVMHDPSGLSTGSGFVSYSDVEAAYIAISEMNGKIVGNKPLYVALERHKEDIRARLREITGNHSYRDILLGDKSLEDIILGDKGLKRKSIDLSAITLNVTPGSDVIPEDIMLDEDLRVNNPSFFKEFYEEYKDQYVCLFFLPMSSGHMNSTILDTIRLRDTCDQIKSSGGKFEVICIPTHFQAEEDGAIYNPYWEHSQIKLATSFRHIHIDHSSCLKRVERMIGVSKDPKTIYIVLGPTHVAMRRKVVTILDSNFIKWHGDEAFPFTTEKIQQLVHEDEALRKKRDLVALLSVHDCDYVISNDLTKVLPSTMIVNIL